MDAIFERLVQISLSGSILVLAVLLLRLILKKAPRRTVCLLWMLAVLRLLVPLQIESEWSLQPEPVTIIPPKQTESFDSGTVHTAVPPENWEDPVEYPLRQPQETPKQTEPMDILPWIWLAGAVLLAAHGAVSYLRLKRRVRSAVILEEGVWVCPGLDTAFVLGFFRPQIYLPLLSGEERELVLLHERQHIRRLDPWWKLLAYAAVTVHWFNPLAWVTYVLMCRDMELACDQETVKDMDNARRKAYSEALLNCAARRSGIAACPVAFGEISVKERIRMVLNYKKPGFWVTLFALIAAAAVGFFLMTSPKELTGPERCEQALNAWQEMEVYRFHQSQANGGDALNDWSVMDFWRAEDEHLMRFLYESESVQWLHWTENRAYSRVIRLESGEETDTGWRETEASEADVIPWILRLDWDALTIHNWEAADQGRTVLLTVDFPALGAGTMRFHFDAEGELMRISRTFTQFGATVISETIELVETDPGKIREELNHFGVVPELVQLYSELERVQNLEYLHLVTEIEDLKGRPDYEGARQEFIRWGNNYYRNYENRCAEGSWVVTALKFGDTIYVRQNSEDGVAPNLDWREDDSREYDHVMLLSDDWRDLEVDSILREPDGSAVITLRRDPEKASNGIVTYYSILCEFRLDGDGKLISMTYRDESKEIVDNSRAKGVYEGPYRAVTYILDTPDEELKERILEVRREARS